MKIQYYVGAFFVEKINYQFISFTANISRKTKLLTIHIFLQNSSAQINAPLRVPHQKFIFSFKNINLYSSSLKSLIWCFVLHFSDFKKNKKIFDMEPSFFSNRLLLYTTIRVNDLQICHSHVEMRFKFCTEIQITGGWENYPMGMKDISLQIMLLVVSYESRYMVLAYS